MCNLLETCEGNSKKAAYIVLVISSTGTITQQNINIAEFTLSNSVTDFLDKSYEGHVIPLPDSSNSFLLRVIGHTQKKISISV